MTINKLQLLIAAILILVSFSSFSQDVVLKKNGDSIIAKIIEIKSSDISFRKVDNLNGPLYTLPKNEILKIYFENCTIENFNSKSTNEEMSIDQIKSFLKNT